MLAVTSAAVTALVGLVIIWCLAPAVLAIALELVKRTAPDSESTATAST